MPCHATPTNNRGNNRARSWLFRTFVKAKVKVHLIGLTLSLTVLSWMLDSTRKGREPRFTLSSSNQLIVQTRRAVFGVFLLLDAAALGFAAAVLHLRYAPVPLYEFDDVVTTALLPVVTAAVDGLWVAALLLLDLYYPLTFLSKPVGELSSLVILIVLHLTTALYLYVDLSHTPFSVKSNDNAHQRSFSITALILVLFLILQAIALTFSFLVVFCSTIRYLHAGRWDALDHPICRYDPKAVLIHRHPLELLHHTPSTLHMLSLTTSQSTSHAELLGSTSRELNRETGSQGRPGLDTSEARSISVRGFV